MGNRLRYCVRSAQRVHSQTTYRLYESEVGLCVPPKNNILNLHRKEFQCRINRCLYNQLEYIICLYFHYLQFSFRFHVQDINS